MSLNAVNNNAPAGAHAQAAAADSTVNELNQPSPKAPPGSIGHQLGAIQSQLVSGNPGGVGAGFGLGVAFDVNS
jgi:hypothetical protein